jgi:hypothetical protein
MRIFIQKEGKEFDLEACFDAYQSFTYLNWWNSPRKDYIIKKISLEKLNSLVVKKTDIFIGTIEFVKVSFILLGVRCPDPLNIPDSIMSYSKRTISFGYKKDLVFPCFIKPCDEVKLFTGFEVDDISKLKLITELKDDTKLMISSVVNFISEYRCFVYKNELVGIKHYTGDFKIPLSLGDINTIECCIRDYYNAPISYCIDFGITDSGDLQLIEVNDFFSCGTYGFTGNIYTKMIIDRFRQIVKS